MNAGSEFLVRNAWRALGKKRREAAGGFYLSYGSGDVETEEYASVTWEKDGIFYELSAFDADQSAEEMFEMAAGVIRGE